MGWWWVSAAGERSRGEKGGWVGLRERRGRWVS